MRKIPFFVAELALVVVFCLPLAASAATDCSSNPYSCGAGSYCSQVDFFCKAGCSEVNAACITSDGQPGSCGGSACIADIPGGGGGSTSGAAAQGANCNWSAGSCATGLYCADDGTCQPDTTGTTSGGAGQGANCNWSAGSCATGLYCADDGTCQPDTTSTTGGATTGHDYASCVAIAGNDPANCAVIWTQGGTTGNPTTSGGGGTTGGGLNLNAIKPYTDNIITLINKILFPLLFAVAFITFLYGVATKYILSRGDESKIEEGHKLILWGIIGFVVMISIWGIVNVVSDTVGFANDNTLHRLPQTPLTP